MSTTISSSGDLAVIEPRFSEAEKLALAGFLAGYSGLTREAYALDLRQFTAWCRQRQLRLLAVRRADIELFARDLEAAGRARSTVTRRLSTIARRAAGPARSRSDHPPGRPPRRPGQEDRASHAAPRLHHRRPRRRRPLRDVQEAASHADPHTTIRYDRARVSLDRHATYIVAAYIAGAAR